MRLYFAPLEGLTDEIFRRLHHKYFPGITCYYTPFFSPTMHQTLSPKEQRQLPVADSLPFRVVPQVLTKDPEDFLWFAGQCHDRGYDQVNLNLGCPSGTVTAKGKGSGMLRDPDGLDSFLYTVFRRSPLPVSVKTRIGFSAPEEFPRLVEIMNRYPIAELTVHPRVREGFYKAPVDMQTFAYAVEHCKAPVCYNGDLCSYKQIEDIHNAFPAVYAVMIGRGLIGDPGMLTPEGTQRDVLERFHSELMEAYLAAFGGSRNAMFRMKEHWCYLKDLFEGSERLYKQLRKTTDITQYRAITREIFQSLPMKKL